MFRRLAPFVLLAGVTAFSQQAGSGADAPASTVPLAPGLAFADPLTVAAATNFLHGVASRAGEGRVNAVIEIPAGACEKWEVKADGVLRWDMKDGKPRHVKYLGYPCNYGMVPQTCLGKELGGDGDPLDVLVLGPALPRGTIVPVTVIGAIRLVDAGEQDDKLIAVVPGSPLSAVTSIAELDAQFPGITAILATWFENYKGKDALQCGGFAERDATVALLTTAEGSYRTQRGKSSGN